MNLPPLPPSPNDGLLARLMKLWTADPLQWLGEITRECGDVAYLKIGHQQFVPVNHPELVHNVLVTHKWNFTRRRVDQQEWRQFIGDGLIDSSGDYHMHQRRLLEPAFRHERIQAYGALMTEASEWFANRWQDGATIDVHREMMHLTLAIAGKAFLDADVGSGEADRISHALEVAYRFNNFLQLPFAHLLEKLPLPPVRHFQQAIVDLNEIIKSKIAARRQSGEDKGDVLSLLLKAREHEGPGGYLTDNRVRDEALTILLSGHETTANALTFTWYLLSQYPEAEARMHEELQRVLGGRAPTTADVPNLPYTEAVFAESLRLYPPLWCEARQSIGEYVLGEHLVPAESTVIWSQYLIQRDPRWFTDPDKFVPERMTRAGRAGLHRFAYFPFGGGTHQCIGESFAWLEGVLVLATLAQRWRVQLPPGQALRLEPLITLRPKDGLQATLVRRSGS